MWYTIEYVYCRMTTDSWIGVVWESMFPYNMMDPIPEIAGFTLMTVLENGINQVVMRDASDVDTSDFDIDFDPGPGFDNPGPCGLG